MARKKRTKREELADELLEGMAEAPRPKNQYFRQEIYIQAKRVY